MIIITHTDNIRTTWIEIENIVNPEKESDVYIGNINLMQEIL